jgi:hypothetical protein
MTGLRVTPAPAGEKERIELLVRRDGAEQARAWVERTLKLYREAIASGSHAASDAYRPRFEQSIRDFEAWLEGKSLQ